MMSAAMALAALFVGDSCTLISVGMPSSLGLALLPVALGTILWAGNSAPGCVGGESIPQAEARRGSVKS
jgi:hypothetical protein